MKKTPYESIKEMFHEMVIKKNASVIPNYYHPDFLMIANEKQMNYEDNLKFHQDIYKTPIQYKIEYDDQTVVEEKEKVAFRAFITTQRPHESPRKLELIVIAHYRDGKIYRIWELTYPDWSKLPAFQEK